METIAERVAALVKRVYRNVNAAAKAIGVPQRTLARIVDGETPNPRVAVAQKIAEGFGCSLAWLLSGEGDPPKVLSPDADSLWPPLGAAQMHWDRTVAELRLDPDLLRSVSALPGAILHAWLIFAKSTTGEDFFSLGADSPNGKALTHANDLIYEAWTTFFRGMVESYGIERVRAKLVAGTAAVHLGFGGVAMERLWAGLLSRKTIEEWAATRPSLLVESIADNTVNPYFAALARGGPQIYQSSVKAVPRTPGLAVEVTKPEATHARRQIVKRKSNRARIPKTRIPKTR